MSPVVRWLLVFYLPLLAPLVLLTFFTWPWKVIGHSFRGLAMSIRSVWLGYSRSRQRHKRKPFSLWRNMFLGCWVERAKQYQSRHGGSISNTGSSLDQTFLETLLEATDITMSRICSELRTSVMIHGILAAVLFLALIQPVRTVRADTKYAVAADVCALFAGLGFIISLAVVGVNTQLVTLLSSAGTSEQFYWFICTWERAGSGGQLASAAVITFTLAAGLSAAFQLFSDWVFILLLFSAATLLYGYLYFWSDSMWCPYNGAHVQYSQSFYRELLGKETLRAHPSCCAFWELEPVQAADARGSLYDSMDRYLWRESQVSWYVASAAEGATRQNPLVSGKRSQTQSIKLGSRTSPIPLAAASTFGGEGAGATTATTATTATSTIEAIPIDQIRPTPAPVAPLAVAPALASSPSSAAAAAAAAAAAPTASVDAGPSKTASDPALYSSWPSLMQYTSSSGSSKLQGRGKRTSGSGLQAVVEGSGGKARPTSLATDV